jgi:5-methyltetrahydrofolate--homocysteine methyltransferase
MNGYDEIYRYMGHSGAADALVEALVSSSLEKLAAVYAPLHVTTLLPCAVSGNSIQIDTLEIESKELAEHLCGCTQTYIFAATLGAAVDRLIIQRLKIDSAEALCIQACAAAEIENYCKRIERELSEEAGRSALCLRPRFSPGYGDFSIAYQTNILRILQAQKKIGLTETKTHMLTPLKSVTAIIGASRTMATNAKPEKCDDCGKMDCPFKGKEKRFQ